MVTPRKSHQKNDGQERWQEEAHCDPAPRVLVRSVKLRGMRGKKWLTDWVLAKDDGRQSDPSNLSNTGRYVQCSRLHRREPK